MTAPEASAAMTLNKRSLGAARVAPIGFGARHLRPRPTRTVAARHRRQPPNPLVIDELVSVDPWSARYLRVYGTAELVNRPGRFGHAPYMCITPTISWSWNLDGAGFSHDREVVPRRSVHHPVPAHTPGP
jgi:pyridoxamine 5'-phosphate oxidase family protein